MVPLPVGGKKLMAMGRALMFLAYMAAIGLMYWWGDAPYPGIEW
jgi:hypothetical protein